MTLTTAITLGEVARTYRYDFGYPLVMLPELSDTLSTPAEARVSKGAAWLEEQGAYDWPEKILAPDARFQMSHCGRCAVGLALGDYMEFHRRGNLAGKPAEMHLEGLRHGFTATTPAGYRELEEAWIERAQTEMKWRS
jgi:hypothetical protein